MTLYRLLKNRQHRERLKEILHVFFEEEFGYIIARIDLHHHLPFKKRMKSYLAKEKLLHPETRLRQAFEKLGPTFVKFGQLLSLRPDLIPPEYIAEFEKMQDHNPTFSFDKAKAIIEEELKKPLSKIFSSFNEKPIASASIAQVYKAKIGHQDVAVKVQRPGIQKIIREDIELMYQISELAEQQIPGLKNYRIRMIIHEFEKWTIKELNFNIEAYYAEKIRKNFLNSKFVKVPKMYEKYTTNKVLVMEFIEGIPLHDIKALKKKKISLKKVIKNGYYMILKQVFVDGFFHADPHPGNILVLRDGRIGLIDFGILGHFDKKLKQAALELFEAFVMNDAEKTIRILVRMNPQSNIDVASFSKEVRDIFEQLRTTSPEDLEIGPLIRETLATANRYHLEIPADFVLYGKTVSIIEGIALRYQPDFKFSNESKKILKEIIGPKQIAQEILDRTMTKVSEYKDLADTFPETAKEILDKVKNFKLQIDVADADIGSLTTELERSSGNLAMGMIIAALIVGSALIMQIGEEKFLYNGGFILAGILGLWLIHRTIFIKLRRNDE